ncbi:MAG: protein kinase [Gemmataceae bacterium]|nr:protein kinase [Gemmataceae bacterium]
MGSPRDDRLPGKRWRIPPRVWSVRNFRAAPGNVMRQGDSAWTSTEPRKRALGASIAIQIERSPRSEESLPPTDPGLLVDAACAYRDFVLEHRPADSPHVDSWCDSYGGDPEHAQLFRDVHRSNPKAAYQLAEGLTALPEVGTEFLGFHLIAELGRGAFGRVYLAQQGELANRHVALKVSTQVFDESQTLAQLQHTHIVPIYSLHRAGSLQAVCMPYFGATTLADILRDLGARDALPQSGKGLISTLVDRKSKTRNAVENSKAAPETPAVPHDGVPSPAIVPVVETEATLRMLEGFTYVEAVLWIVARVADGLAHAHERSVLHRDLKPANILLTDEGQPMLLDFNLSENTKLRGIASAAVVGGTLPYMAPEHLAAFGGGAEQVDARSDVYSLGIILFQLLTGRYPFCRYHGPLPGQVSCMIEERRQPPPRVRSFNRAVSPAVESIVRHCLQSDPAKRYQSAAQLRDDLGRQLDHEPLRFAPEPSLWERIAKWRVRHPRLAPSVLAGSALVLLAIAMALLAVRDRDLKQRDEEMARLGAMDNLTRFGDELKSARLLLSARSGDQGAQAEGDVIARRALDRYQVLEQPAWQDQPAFCRLSADEQAQVRGNVGEILLLLAGNELARLSNDPSRLQVALDMNQRAETCYPSNGAPRALWMQRAELARVLERPQDAERWQMRAEQMPVREAWDHYLLAREHATRGRFGEALPLLRQAVEKDPRNFGAWFLLGNCLLDGYGREADAVAHYTTCIALWPNFHVSWFNRGLAQLRQRDYEAACADFTRALELRPGHVESLIHRALAQQGRGKHAEAQDDLTRALDLGTPSTRVYFMRSRVRQLLGDAEGARRDLEVGLKREPADEESWIARGIARVNSDPRGSLADFAQAVKVNPRSLAGLENQAHVLSEKLGRTADAIELLDRVLALYPDFTPARGGRGVLRARLGQRAAAQRDAQETLRRDTRPPILYHVAGIYALTAVDHPEDRREALRLLSGALQQGYGLDVIDSDPDLDPLRQDAEFRAMVKAARDLRNRAQSQR